MRRFMRKPHEGMKLLYGRKNKRDDRGSAIVIVIIAMALIGILASTILWASYLNYRIKVNDLKVKNSFYSAETVVEQIVAGVKKDVVSASINEAYQEILSNWDALGTDENRQSYFITAYIEAVEEKLGVYSSGSVYYYDKSILHDFVDANLWEGAAGNVPSRDGYIVNAPWDGADPVFKAANEVNGYGSMSVRNLCVEFYDSDGLLSIINTDIAIDVPKLSFTQAGTIDRLYPYVFVGDTGIVTKDNTAIDITGSIYGGDDGDYYDDQGGIRIGSGSRVTVNEAAYIISGGDIVVGNDSNFLTLLKQNADLVVREVPGVGTGTNVYARGLAVNGSHLSISGRTFIANDLILSGSGSDVSLSGQYFGYGDTISKTLLANEADDEGNFPNVNPAESSSAIVINGKDSTVDLTGLNTLQLAGRAYVSLSSTNTEDDKLPHVLMGESISVKSNQIAYLVPAECVGTLNGKTVIGQNPMSFNTWSEIIASIPGYAADEEQYFKLVDADIAAAKLGGESLMSFGIGNMTAETLSSVVNPADPVATINGLNNKGKDANVRFLYMPEKQQVYLYLVMDANDASEYFNAYYSVNSNKTSLDSYFNQYVSGGIRLKENVQGYTVMGNSMVSKTNASRGDEIEQEDGVNLVQLLSSVIPSTDEDGDGEDGDDQSEDPDAYTEVSKDNVKNVENAKDDLDELIANAGQNYKNLLNNLLETGGGPEETVFENLIRLEGTGGLEEYFDGWAPTSRIAEFVSGSGLKAVLVDSSKQSGHTYKVSDDKLRLVIAIGDVEVTKSFKGLIIASGTITVSGNNITCESDGEGVYEVLQAESQIEGDPNVPANIFRNGSGMIKNGYEEADVDENGNLNINYSEIVRYENWIKK